MSKLTHANSTQLCPNIQNITYTSYPMGSNEQDDITLTMRYPTRCQEIIIGRVRYDPTTELARAVGNMTSHFLHQASARPLLRQFAVTLSSSLSRQGQYPIDLFPNSLIGAPPCRATAAVSEVAIAWGRHFNECWNKSQCFYISMQAGNFNLFSFGIIPFPCNLPKRFHVNVIVK